MARPSIYTEEIADEICERLANGEFLVAICADDHMPHRTTVFRWERESPDFATRCAHARVYQGDWHAHRVRVTADQCTPETAVADRVKISAYEWLASKLDRKRYGDDKELPAPPPPAQTINVALLSADERAVLRLMAEKLVAPPRQITIDGTAERSEGGS